MSYTIRSSLLEEDNQDSYFAPTTEKPSSYYKRGNLLTQTSSFRQKCKGLRARSSSYTSLEENKNYDYSQEVPQPSTPSRFSRKMLGMTTERSNTAPTSYFESNNITTDPFEDNFDQDEEEKSDENTFFAKQGNYGRQNLSRSTTWKSCVLRAVGVKRSR